MEYHFDRNGVRTEGIGWLRPTLTPEPIRESGYPGFSGAEFEFETCPAFSRGVAEMAARGMFGYTLPLAPYREHVCGWMKNVRGAEIEPDWIVPTHGTIFGLATALRLWTAPEDALIILTPGYNRYEQAATRLGRKTIRVPLKEEHGVYSLDLPALEAAMRVPENRVLCFSNPCNPTGNIYSEAELQKIAELSKECGTLVYSDEIFADIVFDGAQVPCYAALAGENAPAISATGMGKVFGLTGVNHANILIRDPELRARYETQRNADHYGSLDPMVHAGLLSGYSQEGIDWLNAMKAYVRENYRLIRDFFAEHLPEVIVTEPEGTFVLWVDYSPLGIPEKQLFDFLNSRAFFAGDPGDEYYGRSCTMRYSIALPRAELKKALDRFAEVLPELKK